MENLNQIANCVEKISNDLFNLHAECVVLCDYIREGAVKERKSSCSKDVIRIKAREKSERIPDGYMNGKEFSDKFLICGAKRAVELSSFYDVPSVVIKRKGSDCRVYFDARILLWNIYESHSGATFKNMMRLRRIIPELDRIISDLSILAQ